MQKFLKKVFVYGTVSILGYFGIKKILQMKDVTKLNRALPEFLNNIIGEKPSLKVTITFSTIAIEAGFSAEVIEREPTIDEIIREYIEDFYPTLAQLKLNVNAYAIRDNNEEAEEECNCEDCEDCTCEDETEETVESNDTQEDDKEEEPVQEEAEEEEDK